MNFNNKVLRKFLKYLFKNLIKASQNLLYAYIDLGTHFLRLKIYIINTYIYPLQENT